MDTPTEQQKKKGGRPQSEVWRHYEKKPLKSAGHFSAKCNYCRTYWPRGHPNELEDHLANNCREVPELVHFFYLGVVLHEISERKILFLQVIIKKENLRKINGN